MPCFSGRSSTLCALTKIRSFTEYRATFRRGTLWNVFSVFCGRYIFINPCDDNDDDDNDDDKDEANDDEDDDDEDGGDGDDDDGVCVHLVTVEFGIRLGRSCGIL